MHDTTPGLVWDSRAIAARAAWCGAIIDTATDAIVSTDAPGGIVCVNPAAEATFGHSAPELLEQPLGAPLPPGLAETHAAHVGAFAVSHAPARYMRNRRSSEGGRENAEPFQAEATSSHVRGDGISRFTAILRDVTDRQRAETERKALRAREYDARVAAEPALAFRDQILAIVSHDLRNPVATVPMALTSLEENAEASTPERRAERIGIGHESVAWMHRLIADLPDVASIDAGRLALTRQLADPVVVIVGVRMAFEQSCAARGIRLVVETPERLPRPDIDAERIQQVLANLLANAIKYSPDGGTIAIVGEEGDTELRLSVCDSGPGVPAEHRPHIFDRCWHARRSARTRTRGTGFGLSIAKGIVEAHGGRTWLETADRVGGAFTFTIPVPQDVATVGQSAQAS